VESTHPPSTRRNHPPPIHLNPQITQKVGWSNSAFHCPGAGHYYCLTYHWGIIFISYYSVHTSSHPPPHTLHLQGQHHHHIISTGMVQVVVEWNGMGMGDTVHWASIPLGITVTTIIITPSSFHHYHHTHISRHTTGVWLTEWWECSHTH